MAEAGVNPLEHYYAFGWLEGRDPSAFFDTALYLAENPDVAAAGINPLDHFLRLGVAEGAWRSPPRTGSGRNAAHRYGQNTRVTAIVDSSR